MTPGQIQGALKDKKITQKTIAGELGVSENSVSAVINQLHVSDRIMKAVAEKLGRPHWEVWDYYKKRPRRSTSKTLKVFQTPAPRKPDRNAAKRASA